MIHGQGYEDWLAGGRRVRLPQLGREVFCRVDGDGPLVTLVHGFPTSSYDWTPLLPYLHDRQVLSMDLLGFGDSDKPHGHRYDIVEQADLVEELWSVLGLSGGDLVVHDYGVSVGQELLARGLRPGRMGWLNGAVYPGLHRPIEVQELLRGKQGEALAASLRPEDLGPGLRQVCAKPLTDALVAELGEALARRDGLKNLHLLIRYIDDRSVHQQRWVHALETATVPYLFVWGVRDPVSGEHVLGRLQVRLPDAEYEVLDDVGHYPQLESPERVGPRLARFLTSPSIAPPGPRGRSKSGLH